MKAFTPRGLSAALSVTSTSTATPIQVLGNNNNATQHMLYNAGPNDCWIAHSAASNPTAIVPVAGTPSAGTPIPAGAIMVLSFPPNTYFAAISKATETATLYITGGEGD